MYEKFGQFIDGKWQQSEKKETYEVINPATEEVLGHASKATPVDVEKALKSAEKGLEVWKKTSPWKRSSIIRKIADLIRKKQDVLAKWMTLEVGKPLAEGKGEAGGSADIFEWNSEETKRIYGQTVESRFEDTRVHVYYQPVGVVAALVPWNFPLILASRKISTALAAGCAVICKPDVITPGTVMELVDICREAGVPPGVVNLLSGDPPSIASQLISSDIVKKISITGSTRVGKLILKQAADKVQRVTMELSGHAPFIVHKDADIEKATDMAMAAKYRNNGQVCISPSRFYIHTSKKEQFTKSFVDKTLKLKIGNGMNKDVQLGPITTKKRLEEIEKLVETTKNEGAKVLCGGRRPAGFNKGYFYEPTVFDQVTPNMEIIMEEAFSPVIPVQRVKSLDEAITMSNSTRYGLGCSIFTRDIERALTAADNIQAGTFCINSPLMENMAAPFGGMKQSGIGREHGIEALEEFREAKHIFIDYDHSNKDWWYGNEE